MKTTLLLLALLSLPVFAGDLPPDAAALKGKRDAKIAEINQLYANELEKLQKLALKNGSLEAANAIEKEIAAVVPNPFKASLEGKWTVRFNNDGATQPREFKGQNMYDQNGMSYPWWQEGNVIMIKWGKTDTDKITYDPSRPDILEGVNSRGVKVSYKRVGREQSVSKADPISQGR